MRACFHFLYSSSSMQPKRNTSKRMIQYAGHHLLFADLARSVVVVHNFRGRTMVPLNYVICHAIPLAKGSSFSVAFSIDTHASRSTGVPFIEVCVHGQWTSWALVQWTHSCLVRTKKMTICLIGMLISQFICFTK